MNEVNLSSVLKLFRSEVIVVNIGLKLFHDELRRQNVHAVQVIWQPKPKLEKDLEEILKKVL